MRNFYDPYGITDPNGWTRKDVPLSGPWRPASGYVTKNGRPMWRVWNDAAHPSKAELCDKRGTPRLFRNFDAAHKVATKCNQAV